MSLHANGTRRSLWHSKLGIQKSHAFIVPIKSIVQNGGMIPCISVIIQRQYPLLFMETLPDGTKIVRNIYDEEYESEIYWVIFFQIMLLKILE